MTSAIQQLVIFLSAFLLVSCVPTDIANLGIDKSITFQGTIGVSVYKQVVSYDFGNLTLPLPKGYDTWDDASFFGRRASLLYFDSSNQTINELLYASQAAGTSRLLFLAALKAKKRDERFADVAELIQEAYNTTGEYQVVEKERPTRAIYSWLRRGWTTSNRHKTRASAVQALATFIGSLAGETFDFGRRSVCVETNDGNACLSWSGVTNSFKISLAKQILEDARGIIGNSAMSLEAHDGAYGCKRDLFLRKRCGTVSVCVSDRPKGCK